MNFTSDWETIEMVDLGNFSISCREDDSKWTRASALGFEHIQRTIILWSCCKSEESSNRKTHTYHSFTTKKITTIEYRKFRVKRPVSVSSYALRGNATTCKINEDQGTTLQFKTKRSSHCIPFAGTERYLFVRQRKAQWLHSTKRRARKRQLWLQKSIAWTPVPGRYRITNDKQTACQLRECLLTIFRIAAS